MIANHFKEAFSKEWVKNNVHNQDNELSILRDIIPWQKIIEQLVPYYHASQGPFGKSLRMVVAILILSKLRKLSDRKVISEIQENRYFQYFCNIPDKDLFIFLDPSSLPKIRKRLGAEGTKIIEEIIFKSLLESGVIKDNHALIDSTVLEDNIIHPNDIRLLFFPSKK